MDQFKRAFYEVSFEKCYLRKRGIEFQNFFSEIMEKCYPRDFQRVRPWGNVGDRKNDGYLKSQRTLYQVYAPNEMKASETIAKIEEDYHGAFPYWKEYFKTWVFVHNSIDGLGADISKKLLDIEKDYPEIKIENWGFEELRQKIFSLNEEDISSILGPALSMNDVNNLGFDSLKRVLLSISRQQPTTEPDLLPVPREKLTTNDLSDNVESLLKVGMRKASLVEQLFRKWPNPMFGDEIAEAFRKKYSELKNLGLHADTIFGELQIFAGGSSRGTPEHEASVLAVLAHLFEKCEIFERPPTVEEDIT